MGSSLVGLSILSLAGSGAAVAQTKWFRGVGFKVLFLKCGVRFTVKSTIEEEVRKKVKSDLLANSKQSELS